MGFLKMIMDFFKPDLLEACRNGNLYYVKLILSCTSIDINKPNNVGSTPFHCACYSDHPEIIKILMADPRFDPSQDPDIWDPLSSACYWNHPGVVQFLLTDPE